MPPRRSRTALAAALAALLGLTVLSPAVAVPAPASPQLSAAPSERTKPDRKVLVISVDGLTPRALHILGRERAPGLHRLLRQGARTRNARTALERTSTLPNHVGMVTGRRVWAGADGHGVWWNNHRRGSTVQQAAGEGVGSIFSRAQRWGFSAALFSGKAKLSIMERSWPRGVDRYVRDANQARLTRATRRDLVKRRRAVTFLHMLAPDRAGHRHGYLSTGYLDAVQRTDRHIRLLLRAIDNHPRMKRRWVVVLTSDHGGARGATSHNDKTRFDNYRVPFVVWGARLPRGDLYELSTGYADPGRDRPWYRKPRQPIRNLDVANLTTRLLGIGRVPGSMQRPGARLLD